LASFSIKVFCQYTEPSFFLSIRRAFLPQYELYDLASDPYEKTNLADQKPNKLKTLTEQMMAQLKAEDAQYAIDSSKKELRPILP